MYMHNYVLVYIAVTSLRHVKEPIAEIENNKERREHESRVFINFVDVFYRWNFLAKLFCLSFYACDDTTSFLEVTIGCRVDVASTQHLRVTAAYRDGGVRHARWTAAVHC